MSDQDQIFKARLSEMLGGFGATEAEETPRLVERIWEGLQALAARWKDDRPEGISGFFSFVFHSAGEMVKLVQDVLEAVGVEDKKMLIQESLAYLYRKVDPNLPYIPEPIESKIEDWILDHILPPLIDMLFSFIVE